MKRFLMLIGRCIFSLLVSVNKPCKVHQDDGGADRLGSNTLLLFGFLVLMQPLYIQRLFEESIHKQCAGVPRCGR